MSNYLIEKNGIKYNAVDNHFGHHEYGYIEIDKLEEKNFLTQEEFNNIELICDFCLSEDQFGLNEDEQICSCDLMDLGPDDFK